MKKTAQRRCHQTLTAAYVPRTLRTCVLKKWPPSQLFLLHVFPQSVINLHQLFVWTHGFTCFLKIKACMGVIYFLVGVRKHKSHLCTNIRTTVGKKHTMIWRKMWTFEWNHILALFYDGLVCFLLPKCVFFYQWCLSGLFSSQHYVSMIFVKQCW